MKNVIILIVFCFVGKNSFAQQNLKNPLREVVITREGIDEPSTVYARAQKIENSTDPGSAKQEETLTVLYNIAKKPNSRGANITASVALSTDENMSLAKGTVIQNQSSEIILERQSVPSNIKAKAEKKQ